MNPPRVRRVQIIRVGYLISTGSRHGYCAAYDHYGTGEGGWIQQAVHVHGYQYYDKKTV